MSLSTNSVENVNTPRDLTISNVFQLTTDKQTGCNPFNDTNNFGNYFQRCMPEQRQAYWGSDKPAPDVCTPGLGPHEGIPCNSIWNNLTKRKSVVGYKRP